MRPNTLEKIRISESADPCMLVDMHNGGQSTRPWQIDLGDEVAGGDANSFGFFLSSLELISGEQVPIGRTGVTAIVGGNNVGKSTLLREIYGSIHRNYGQPTPVHHVLDKCSYEWEGTNGDMLEWIAKNYAYSNEPSAPAGFISPSVQGGGRISAADLVQYRRASDQAENPLAALAPFLSYLAVAQQRFEHVQPVQRRVDFGDPPIHPVHYLEDSSELHEQFLAAATSIFGADLTLDPLSGSVFFRVGKPSVDAPPINQVYGSGAGAYKEELRSLPGLHTQGDGMQSALALLLPVITASFPVILVDEPEAFLHPPQARILGATLARLAHSRGVQLIVATHDRHFLTGLLDAEEVAVSVIRLSRDRGTSVATHLESDKLRSAWGTASLRHSNLLDGLFHRIVVVSENERDCRFYAAALEAMDEEFELPVRPHDVLFLSSSGKGNIRPLSEVLLASGVPVVASPDLDIVNDEQTIQKLFTLFEGDWNEIQDIYAAATAEFRTPRVARRNEDVLRLVQSVLEKNLGDIYSGNTKKDITNVLRVESEWQRLKDYGVNGFKAQRGKADELLTKLEERGIVPVHVGELERFAPEVNMGKGDAWLEGALAVGAHRRAPVRLHLTKILAAAGLPAPAPK